jgi:hypothetical protein
VDQFLEAIREAQPINRGRLSGLARWVCESGVTMNQVKVGIALLGIAGSPSDADLVIRLGLFDVLTLYSVVALRNLLADPDQAIFDLTKQSDGWGRIHALRRLSGTSDPVIRDWILRGGYDSGVIVEETAYIGATAGGLAAALQGTVDDELLDHAGILLAGLAVGGPAEDMSDYASGELSMELYLNEMTTASVSINRLESVDTLARYLGDWADTNPRLSAEGRARLAHLVAEVLSRADWREMIAAALDGEVLEDVRCATPLASRFGLDPRPVLRQWIERVPHDEYVWYRLAHNANRDELLSLFDLAHRLLPVSALPTGATKSLGFEPEYAASRCFEFLLQELVEFPSTGWREIKAGLASRFFRSRNIALRAFAKWPRDGWPADAQAALLECAEVEPDAKLKATLIALTNLKANDH